MYVGDRGCGCGGRGFWLSGACGLVYVCETAIRMVSAHAILEVDECSTTAEGDVVSAIDMGGHTGDFDGVGEFSGL